MNLNQILINSFQRISRIYWLVFIPILLDLITLFANLYILKEPYQGASNFFRLKLGVISAPPSINYLLEDFPTILYSYSSQYGATGIIREMNLLNFFIFLSFILISSLFRSTYMGCLAQEDTGKIHFLHILSLGNRYWKKYFLLGLIYYVPLFLVIAGFFDISIFSLVFLISAILFFVQYSIVIDGDISLKENFTKGLDTLGENFNLVLKFALYYGFLFSLSSIIILPLSRAGIWGMILSIVIISILGLGFNKVVLEIYRTLSIKMHSKASLTDHI